MVNNRFIKDCEKAAKHVKGDAVIEDLFEAIRLTLDYYANTLLKNRFAGRRKNPKYPRTKTNKPIPLVDTGNLKRSVLRSAEVKGTTIKNIEIVARTPAYAQYLVARGFDPVSPQLEGEYKKLQKFFMKTFDKLREKRKAK